jgi:hypothetical protein
LTESSTWRACSALIDLDDQPPRCGRRGKRAQTASLGRPATSLPHNHRHRPDVIHGVIETAEYQSTTRAAITIRITDVSRVAALKQRSPRRSLATAATLRALICDRIVPGDVLPVTLIDLSQTGCAVTTNDRRVRVRDRLWLDARLIEGTISTKIRMVRTSADLTAITVGCAFVDPGPDPVVIHTVWTRLQGPHLTPFGPGSSGAGGT